MTCDPNTPEFCLYHYQFLVMPMWWTVVSWVLLGLFLTLATLWVMQRARKQR